MNNVGNISTKYGELDILKSTRLQELATVEQLFLKKNKNVGTSSLQSYFSFPKSQLLTLRLTANITLLAKSFPREIQQSLYPSRLTLCNQVYIDASLVAYLKHLIDPSKELN